MKFEQLYFFKEAVKYNSISIAAEKNYMSQSSVSYAIINLEKELGTELLKRTNAGVTPTQTGELVLQKTEDIFKAVDEIVEMTKEQRDAGEVKITSIPCICDWIIPKALQRLKERSADIMLSITTAESSQVAHDVSSGISEIGILINYGELERNTDLRYTPLFRDEYMLYVGKSSPYWEKDSIAYGELANAPYIAYRDEFKKYNGGLTNMIGPDRPPNIIFRTDNLDSIKSMITHNDYVAFFPRYMSENDVYVQSGLIKRLPISNKSLAFEVGYVESVKYKPNKIDRIVLNVIKETVKKIKNISQAEE
ncbi:DNA-binding transcriptional regulator, LysR family [Sporobacter termitidis DSM 10068]|uniref:DNA-binding transcriptional regulator, LysR family n=1 Tax=Sporobacter termitidis DSM 10068 TaxID=1123282 RepID=A0A1M5UTW7_9FIRM|nr:LysR family transcriptional regulator [Sporobacter termitidis]SHH66350.1 DNA-binding transcriptional regulator, LysR family [Sporobacter termitidis DSM 10068]